MVLVEKKSCCCSFGLEVQTTSCNPSLGTLVTTSIVELCEENKKDMTPKVRGDFT